MASSNVASELDVANLALQRIGVAASASLSGTDKVSVAANRILSDTRDEVQSLFPWNCITSRKALAGTLAGVASFTYVHTLGLDCLRILEVVDTADADAENIPVRREGRNLYVDRLTGYVRFTQQTKTITPWDPLMVTAIETLMASRLALWLTGKVAIAQAMRQEFIQVLGVAVQVGAMEGKYEDNIKTLAMLSQQFIPALASREVIKE